MAIDYEVLIPAIAISVECVFFFCMIVIMQKRAKRWRNGCKWYRFQRHHWSNFPVTNAKKWGKKACRDCYMEEKRDDCQ